MKNLLACAAVALIGFSAAAADQNLVKNSEFNDAKLEGWHRSRKQIAFAPFEAKDGLLVCKGVTAIPNPEFVSATTIVTGIEPGKNYVFGARLRINAKKSKNKSFYLAVREIRPNGKSLCYHYLTPVLIQNGSWSVVEKSFTASKNASSWQFYIVSNRLEDGDFVEIDRVFVCPQEEPAAAAGNLIANGSFEQHLSAGWAIGNDYNNSRHAVAEVPGKGRVLRLNGDTAWKYNNFNVTVQALKELTAGAKYELSFEYKISAEAGKDKRLAFSIREIGSNKKTLRYHNRNVNFTPGEWQKDSLVFVPTKTAAAFQLYITAANLQDGESVMADNIVLRKL